MPRRPLSPWRTTIAQNKLDSFIDGQYQSLDNKVKIFVLLLAIAIPLAGMYYAVYEPNIEEQKGLRKQIADVNEEIHKAQSAIANMPAFMANLAETQRKFDESLVNIPKTNEIPKLLRTISDLGKAAELKNFFWKWYRLCSKFCCRKIGRAHVWTPVTS